MMPRLRLIVFTVLTVAVGLLYGSAVRFLPAPWSDVLSDDDRWDLASSGAPTGLLIGGSLLLLAWRPLDRPLLIQFVAVAVGLVTVMHVVSGHPAMALLAGPALLVVAAYPRWRDLTDVRIAGRVRWPVLGIALATAGPLIVLAAIAVRWQTGQDASGGEPDLTWITYAEHLVVIATAALLTVSGRPGRRPLAVLTGSTLAYLGVASIALPGARGGWGVAGGLLACVAGVAYLVAGASAPKVRPVVGQRANG